MKDYEHFWARVAGSTNCATDFLSDEPTSRWQRTKDWFVWNRETITSVFKWLATVVMLMAAVCVSFDIRPYHIWFLNLGSALWLVTAMLWREWSLIIVNATLLIVYLIGFVKTL